MEESRSWLSVTDVCMCLLEASQIHRWGLIQRVLIKERGGGEGGCRHMKLTIVTNLVDDLMILHC